MESVKNIAAAFIKQFLIICLYIILILGLQSLFIKTLLGNNIVLKNIIYLLIELIVLVVFVLIFRKTLIPDFYDFKKNGKSLIKKFFPYWAIALLIMIISNIIISNFIGGPSNEELNQKALFQLPIYSILSTIIIAPIIEELMTRTIFKDVFKNKYIYYIISALVFASLHLISAQSINEVLFIIPYGTLGFAFAMMYKESNNIWTSIFFHSFHNYIAVAISLIGILL